MRPLLLSPLLLLLGPASAAPPAPPGHCRSDLDCSLNGVCDTATGACACDAPWIDGPSGAEACNVLDVLPHPDAYVPAYGGPHRTDTAWAHQDVTSWGGSILVDDDGKHHLWVSRMAGSAGLSSWGHASQIDHAVGADGPMGVFEFADTALHKEAHNASPLRHKNGSYLLFHIGDSGDKHGSSFLHHSESPAGPWLPLPHVACNNPAPLQHPNGTFFVACHNSHGVQLISSPDVFAGEWTPVTTLAFPDSWTQPAEDLRVEDPFIWLDARGRFHFLAHRFDFGEGFPAVGHYNASQHVLVSGHGFSSDGLEWHFNEAEQPYHAEVTFQNGTVQRFATWERPHLLFNAQGQPTHLVNGVAPYWDPPGRAGPCDGCNAHGSCNSSCVSCKQAKKADFTFTLVTALNMSAAPPRRDTDALQ